MSKKTVSLRRKLPAAVHLSGTGIKVQVVARDPKGADIANRVSDLLQTELLKYDTSLQVEPTHPDDIINCMVTNYSLPPTQIIIRNTTTEKKVGKSYVPVTEPHRYYEANGSIDLTYQAKDAHNGRTIDSDVVTVKYAQEFDETGSSTGSSTGNSPISKSWSAIKTPWNKATGRSNDHEEQKTPTPAELIEILAHQAASRIAARLVNTDEVVEVYLARGKLEDANKLADAGLWTRMLESLEQMTPFPNKEEDAYRLYNIGVAYEALGYQSDEAATAKKFFDQAAINYGKAIDAKPSEKYFLEPQNRIETALAHYRKLEQTLVEATSHTPRSKSNGPEETSKHEPQSREAPSAKSEKARVTNAALKEKVSPANSSGDRPQGGSALTNDQVIKLFKAGMDEENLIATVSEARSTNLDISVDGQLQLVNAGIKGKLLAAIRRKAALQKSHK